MNKLFPIRTIVLAGSVLLQLSPLCFHSHGGPGDVDLSFVDPGSGVNGTVNAVVVQPDGKVIIGGEFTTVKGLLRTNLARLNADGSGDSSFTSGPMSSPVYSLGLQPDGKVLVGSEISNYGLTRLSSDGGTDTNFNANAWAAILSIEPYLSSRVSAIVVQPDGKLLVAGESLFQLNTNGTLDSNFVLGAVGSVYSMAMQPDGKLIVGGYGLARLNADGSLDNSFDAPAAGIVNSLVLQPDGKVLFGGSLTTLNGTNYTPIARLNANGSVDATFGLVSGTGAGGIQAGVDSIALQPDGKVIIGGQFVTINGHSRTNLARFNADGSLDGSYPNGLGGVSGFPLSYSGASVKAVIVQTNGSVLIGGAFTTVNGTNRNHVARLNADGSLDGSFDPGRGVDGLIASLLVEPNRKVLIGGVYTFNFIWKSPYVGQLNADGSQDSAFIESSFNPDLTVFNDYAVCDGAYFPSHYPAVPTVVLVQADGKVLIGFYVPTFCEGFDWGYETSFPFLARFNGDGSRDTSFNADPGIFVYSIARQPDGKLLIGGNSLAGTNQVVRLNADGSLDNSFNAGTGNYSSINAVGLQSDGKVLIGGVFTAANGTNRTNLARLNANGSLDSSFNPGAGANGSVNSLAAQSDGKVLIGGYFTTINGTNRNHIARLNANGSLDSSFNPGTGTDDAVRAIAVQPDGNVLIGGDFTIVNGVARRHVARLYGDSVAPCLNVTRFNAFVIVSWPVTGLSFQLLENTDLSLPNSWLPVAQPTVTNAGQISVTVPTSIGSKFFRLKSP